MMITDKLNEGYSRNALYSSQLDVYIFYYIIEKTFCRLFKSGYIATADNNSENKNRDLKCIFYHSSWFFFNEENINNLYMSIFSWLFYDV